MKGLIIVLLFETLRVKDVPEDRNIQTRVLPLLFAKCKGTYQESEIYKTINYLSLPFVKDIFQLNEYLKSLS